MSNVEVYRKLVNEELFKSASFSEAWRIWHPVLEQRSNNFSNARSIYELGSQLSSVFFATSTEGRGQGVLSAAGNVWESLVCWYLNLIFSGTNAVAIKQKKKLIPECISDAATIRYGTDETNTESDLIVIVFPKDFKFPDPFNISELSGLISSQLHLFELGVVQCKTNWNDNAQIPMLWDMIYRAKGFSDHNISIGRNGHSISDLKKFTYSFVTVPTQKKPYKSTDMAVKRVRNLSGGNYWGGPTKSGVSFCLNEIFSKNFSSAFDRPIIQSVQNAVDCKIGLFD